MDDLWTMTLLGQEEPSLWRMLGPVIVIGVFAVVRWLNEKAKQKERGQQSEDDARGQREDEGGASRAEPVLPEQAQPIRGYDPRIAPAPVRVGEPSQAHLRQGELIVMAEELSVEAAQRQFQREQQQLRDAAVSQARALEAQRSREAARKAETVRRKTTELKPSGQLSPQTTDPGREIFQAKTALLARGQTISQPQIRRAIVWAEILGPPRAVRPYEELF